MRVLIVCSSTATNSLARARVLWDLARENEYETRVTASINTHIWYPLSFETDFCQSLISEEDSLNFRADVVICCKPLPWVVDLGSRIAEVNQAKIVFDIDDPDFEVTFGSHRAEVVLRYAYRKCLGKKPNQWLTTRNQVRRGRKLLSNPSLEELYGPGVVIPHAKRTFDLHLDSSHLRSTPNVGFIGTPRNHKGIKLLREACKNLDLPLIVTASKPTRIFPNEDWIGHSSMNDLPELMRQVDIVCLPSGNSVMATHQLPMKLIDAMNFGKCVVASELPPALWALGESGIFHRPGNVVDLERALDHASKPLVRAEKSALAREKFLKSFSLEIVGRKFATIMESD